MNYLVAAELGSEQPLNWRLDRIRDLALLEEPAAAPADFSLQDYAARSFGIFQDEVQDIVLRISGDGVEDALRWRFHPSQVVEQAAGAVVVRFRASGLLELAWHLFTWGDKIEVLQPAALRDVLVEQLELALRRHKGTTKSGVPAV